MRNPCGKINQNVAIKNVYVKATAGEWVPMALNAIRSIVALIYTSITFKLTPPGTL